MTFGKQKMQLKKENCSPGLNETVMKGATLLTPLAQAWVVLDFQNQQTTLDDLERPESIDNCTKDKVQGDFLWPPHKHLTSATVGVNKFWWYNLPEAKHAIEE